MPSFLPPPNQLINYTANIFNYNPALNLKHWRKALANVKSGTANARIAYVGNSVCLGVGSGTQNAALTSGEIHSLSAPSQLSKEFNLQGINSHWNSFCGSGSSTSSNAWPSITSGVSDTRFVIGSSWTAYNNAVSGGYPLHATTNTNAVTFTPTIPVDTFQVFYNSFNAAGTFSMNINGGASTGVSPSGVNAIVSINKTGTLGINTLNIQGTGASDVLIAAISAWDSSKTWVDVMNAGWSGGCWGLAAAGGNMDNAGSRQCLTGIAPDLTILQGGINDWVLGTSVAAYTGALQNQITAALAGGGDVILSTDNPTKITGGGSATQAAQLALITGMYGLAAKNNLPLIDLWQRWQSEIISDALGFVFHDAAANNYHPSTLGYRDIARAMATFLGNV